MPYINDLDLTDPEVCKEIKNLPNIETAEIGYSFEAENLSTSDFSAILTVEPKEDECKGCILQPYTNCMMVMYCRKNMRPDSTEARLVLSWKPKQPKLGDLCQ